MLMLEECRLRLLGNSVSVRRGGLCGRRGGGGIAPGSVRESVVPVDHDGAAAAHGGIMRRCLNMLKIQGMPAGAVAQLDTRYWFPENAHRLEREKVQNKPTVKCPTRDLMTARKRKGAKQTHRGRRNTRSDVDSSQDRPESAWRRIQDRLSAGRACREGRRDDRIGRSVSAGPTGRSGFAGPTVPRFSRGREQRTPRCVRNAKSRRTKPDARPSQWLGGHGFKRQIVTQTLAVYGERCVNDTVRPRCSAMVRT